MADEIGGKEFVDLIGKTDSSTGKSIGETILSIASGEIKTREGFSEFKGSKARDISETLARGRGFLDPVKQTSDQEIDRMMAEGTGLEVLRGADRQSLENLTNENSTNTPTSAYNEGGSGLYFAIEAASDEQIETYNVKINDGRGHFTSDYYVTKEGKNQEKNKGIIRAVIPSEAKIGSIRSAEYKKDVETRIARIESDLNEMEKSGQDITHARNVLSTIREHDTAEYQSSDILSGYDAVTTSENEIRLLNRSTALSSGVKSVEEMRELYPQTKDSRMRGMRQNESLFRNNTRPSQNGCCKTPINQRYPGRGKNFSFAS